MFIHCAIILKWKNWTVPWNKFTKHNLWTNKKTNRLLFQKLLKKVQTNVKTRVTNAAPLTLMAEQVEEIYSRRKKINVFLKKNNNKRKVYKFRGNMVKHFFFGVFSFSSRQNYREKRNDIEYFTLPLRIRNKPIKQRI